VSEERDIPSQSESWRVRIGSTAEKKTGAENYLSGILGLVVPVQELDMFRNDAVRIVVFTEIALVERQAPIDRWEKSIPKLLLQFLNLSFKVCDDGRLFLESRRSDKFVSVKVVLARNLRSTRRVHDDGRG
jgi:hypothetical protein